MLHRHVRPVEDERVLLYVRQFDPVVRPDPVYRIFRPVWPGHPFFLPPGIVQCHPGPVGTPAVWAVPEAVELTVDAAGAPRL